MKNTIPGWMSERELEVMADAARSVWVGRCILEIGSFLGRSAWNFEQALGGWKATLVCVDPWEGTLGQFDPEARKLMDGDTEFLDESLGLYEHFLINTRDCRSIFPVRLKSSQFHWIMAPSRLPPGLIFIDGDHSPAGLQHDLHACLPDGSFGADDKTLIFGHDYANPRIPHIKPMVDGFAADHGFKVLHYPDTWIFHLRRR